MGDEALQQCRKVHKKSLAKALTAPMDLAMALAQGFHNAPRLYGDDTVRKPVRITGCHSGLRAAWSEFIYEVSSCTMHAISKFSIQRVCSDKDLL